MNYKYNMEQPNSEIVIYQNQDGNIKIDVRLEEETVWLKQAMQTFSEIEKTIGY